MRDTGLLVETRLELAAQKQGDHTARRGLENDEDSPVTVTQTEAIVADRVEAVVTEMRGELDAANRKGARELLNATEHFGAQVQRLERDVDNLRSRRRAQGAEPEPEPEEYVQLIKRTATTGSVCHEASCTPGGTTADGSFDYGICSDPARACCYRDACAGHGGRRMQADGYGTGGTGSKCSAADLSSQSDAINVECCDEPDEDCSGGYPHTCNAGCAALLLPFWRDCRSALGKDSRQFEPAVQLCAAAGGNTGAAGGSSLAEQLSVQCTDGTAAEDCIPECNVERHGFILLLNLNGDDTNLVCNLAHGLYSWMGAVSEGGYIGDDFDSFFSSVISGAAGTYMATLRESRDVHTDLIIQPGQVVLVSGDRSLAHDGGDGDGYGHGSSGAPTWGSGGFTVGESASLSLSYLTLAGAISASVGATQLSVSDCVLAGGGTMSLQDTPATFAGTDFGGRRISSSGGSVSVTGCSGALASLSATDGGSMSVITSSGSIGGITVTDSTFSLDISSMQAITLGGGISLRNAGSVALSGFVFPEGTQLSISGDTSLSLSQISRSDGVLLVGSAVYTADGVDPASELDLACVSSQTTDAECGAAGHRGACVSGACECEIASGSRFQGSRCDGDLKQCCSGCCNSHGCSGCFSILGSSRCNPVGGSQTVDGC